MTVSSTERIHNAIKEVLTREGPMKPSVLINKVATFLEFPGGCPERLGFDIREGIWSLFLNNEMLLS